jgi:hypothetical protein
MYHQSWSAFQGADSIIVTELRGTSPRIEEGESYWVQGTYSLSSRERARLSIYATNGEVQSHQGTVLRKGTGTFGYRYVLKKSGMLHMSYYPANGGDGFGGIYFRAATAQVQNIEVKGAITPKPSAKLEGVLAKQVGLVFEQIHLSEITGVIAKNYDVAIVIDPKAVLPKGTTASTPSSEDSGIVTDGMIEYINLKGVTLTQALAGMLRPLNLTFVAHEDTITITSLKLASEAQAKLRPSRKLQNVGVSGSINGEMTPDLIALREVLEQPIEIAFEKIHLSDLIAEISKTHAINIQIDNSVVIPRGPISPPISRSGFTLLKEEPWVTDGWIEYVNLKGVSLAQGLTAILKPLHLASYVSDGKGTLIITTPEKIALLQEPTQDTSPASKSGSGPSQDLDDKPSRILDILEQSISMAPEDRRLRSVLELISDAVGLNIMVDNRVIDPASDFVAADADLLDKTIREVFEEILPPLGLTYSVQDGFVWISSPENIKYESSEKLVTEYYDLDESEVEALGLKVLSTEKSGLTEDERFEFVRLQLDPIMPGVKDRESGKWLSFLHYDMETRRLIVHNTPTNHKRMDEFLERHRKNEVRSKLGPKPTPAKTLKEKLNQPVSMVFEDIHIADLLQVVSENYGIESDIDYSVIRPKNPIASAAQTDSSAQPARYVTDGYTEYLDLKNITLEHALMAILRPLNLYYFPQEDNILITTHEKFRERARTNRTSTSAPQATRKRLTVEEALEQPITLKSENKDLREVVQKIVAQTGITISIDLALIEHTWIATDSGKHARAVGPEIDGDIDYRNTPLKTVLDEILNPLNLSYSLHRRYIRISAEHIKDYDPGERLTTQYYELSEFQLNGLNLPGFDLIPDNLTNEEKDQWYRRHTEKIIPPYRDPATGKFLSFIYHNIVNNQLIVHNTKANHKLLREQFESLKED